MFRAGVSRSLTRSLTTTTPKTPVVHHFRSQLSTITRRPQPAAFVKPISAQNLAWTRWQSRDERPPVNKIDHEREMRIREKEIKPTPDTVSTSSSMAVQSNAMSGSSSASSSTDHVVDSEEREPDMLGGIRSDIQTIRDTFSLQEVPRQAYYMGLAGVIPYAATSLTTVYCAWEINHSADAGSGLFLSHETAEALLHVVEPLQVGYGAVILSFLGAVHWGLEWAKYGGEQGYRRYAIGVISTAVAWPTILMPVEYALISQFLAFNFLYYNDVRAKTRGWTPQWYGVYRFVLTFIVGASIVVSLIGRGQIADRVNRPPGVTDRIQKLRGSQDQLVEEEEARRRFLGDEEEEDDE